MFNCIFGDVCGAACSSLCALPILNEGWQFTIWVLILLLTTGKSLYPQLIQLAVLRISGTILRCRGTASYLLCRYSLFMTRTWRPDTVGITPLLMRPGSLGVTLFAINVQLASSLDQADVVGLIGQSFLCSARDHASSQIRTMSTLTTSITDERFLSP